MPPEDSTFFNVQDDVISDSQILSPSSGGAQGDRDVILSGALSLPKGKAKNLLHSSENGWSEIRLIDKDGRLRALKALKPAFRGQTKYESLLRKEYEISYSLSHTAIREVYDFRNIPGLGNCIEMEWVDGVTLTEFLSGGKAGADTRKKIARQLCDALTYIHSKQIIHRDIKPSNILITHNGNYLKLIDFGLSDADSWSILKGPGGTASFAAPELLEGKPADIRADIYSLGKVIALLLPGEKRLVRKCVMADPEERFKDVSEVKSALERKYWSFPQALLIAATVVAAIWFFGARGVPRVGPAMTRGGGQAMTKDSGPATREDNGAAMASSDPGDTTVTVDVGAIDEMFRQATEMIDDAGSQ
ncbi:MAG: serine/threonine protein kinase [Bacteroidales bacterium]|nr:serine/threonine protein kinase [Bacteroidales bacterium]